MAEQYAEECKDHDAKFQAEQDIEQAKDAIALLRAEHSELCAEMRAASRVQFRLLEPNDLPPARLLGEEPSAICKALRAQLKGLQDAVRHEVKTIKERQENYHSAVEY
jgi:hypothetical protein